MDNQDDQKVVKDIIINPSQIKPGVIDPRHLAVPTTPKNGDMFYSDGTSFKKLSAGINGQILGNISGVPAWQNSSTATNGWTTAASIWTYSSVDGPTGIFTTGSDESANITVGDRIKLTQTTVKYFIVTAIATTTVTVYGGTDYTLANAAITSPFYSHSKSPSGFPTSPIKWTVVTTSTTNDSQTTPTANTWYNPNSNSISIPIGSWMVDYQCVADNSKASSTNVDIFTTLSTANNSESDKELTAVTQTSGASGTLQPMMTAYRNKQLLLAAKTSYFLNVKTGTTSAGPLEIRGDIATTKIRALCAYL